MGILSKKIFLIFTIVLLLSHSASADDKITQADIIKSSDLVLIQSNKHFDEVCTRIKKHFISDGNFLKSFNKDIANYKDFRQLQLSMVFSADNKLLYGTSNYFINSANYQANLNNDKLSVYKKTINSYCIYNEYISNVDCSEKSINRLFR